MCASWVIVRRSTAVSAGRGNGEKRFFEGPVGRPLWVTSIKYWSGRRAFVGACTGGSGDQTVARMTGRVSRSSAMAESPSATADSP